MTIADVLTKGNKATRLCWADKHIESTSTGCILLYDGDTDSPEYWVPSMYELTATDWMLV